MPESPFSEEWESEIDRRLAELDAEPAHTVPWSQVKAEALSRISPKTGELDESPEALREMARKALAEYKAGLTEELDPDGM